MTVDPRAPWRSEADRQILLDAAEGIGKLFEAHVDHPWHIVSGCVYCGPCGVRLYRGQMPEGHPVFKPPPSRSKGAADAMRARWNKDAG